MNEVIEMLLEFGFVPIGETPVQTIKTLKSNPNDHSGFSPKLSTIGGRQKFEKGKRRVTVGKRTVCVYTVGVIQEKFFPIRVETSRNFKTRDLEMIRGYLEAP